MKHFSVTIVVLFSFSISLMGCFSIKPATSKSAKNLVETFYVGDEGTQYFIKPLAFKTDTGKELVMDFSFRQNVSLNKEAIVTINSSLFTTNIQKDVKSIEIQNSSQSTKGKNIKILFSEKNKDTFKLRFSTQITTEELLHLFNNPDWKVVIDENFSESFKPQSKTQKAITRINENILVLFR